MNSAEKKETALVRFCEKAVEKANEAVGRLGITPKRTLHYKDGGSGKWFMPCPLEGVGHDWSSGDCQAWVWVAQGDIHTACRVCTKFENGAWYDDEDGYLDAVKKALGWDDTENVAQAAFGSTTLRHHDYDTFDGRLVLRREKYVKNTQGAKPKWGFKIRHEGETHFRMCNPADLFDKLYPSLKPYYTVVHLYRHEQLVAGHIRPVVFEGEKDAETFDKLMAEVGSDLRGTALPHPCPTVLAEHHKALLTKRYVVIVPDNDDGGRLYAEAWSALLWGLVESTKVYPADQFGKDDPTTDKGRDFTEWVEHALTTQTKREVAAEVIKVIVGTPVLTEPLKRPNAWRNDLLKTTTNSVRDTPGNAQLVMTQHPEITGRARYNIRSGQVEIVDPPWGASVQVGARAIAGEVAIWLERADEMVIKSKSFAEALATGTVSPHYDPLADLASGEWDGRARVDELFTHQLPLAVSPTTAAHLARVFMGDLARKLKGDLTPQRILLGIGTPLDINVAAALLGRHGIRHLGGAVRERQVDATFTRQEAGIVQLAFSTVADRNIARVSLPHLFAPSALVDQRRLSAPLFMAVGELPDDSRTLANIDDRCLLLELVGKPLMEVLEIEAPQLIAEAVARLPELNDLPAPSRHDMVTLDEHVAREDQRALLEALYHYITRENDEPRAPEHASRTTRRKAPMEFVVLSWFVDNMQPTLAKSWRTEQEQRRAFNSACRTMGWAVKGTKGSVQLQLTRAQALVINHHNDADKSVFMVPGVRINPDRLTNLVNTLQPGEIEGGPENPKSGDYSPLFTDNLPLGSAENGGYLPILEGVTSFVEGTKAKGYETCSPRVRSRGSYKVREEGLHVPECSIIDNHYLIGPEAVEEVAALLAIPGRCGIDFETWPTNPAWHGAQASARAPRGKTAARDAAVKAARANGRAHMRHPALVSLAHENGQRLLVRIARWPDGEQATTPERLTQLAEAFSTPPVARLVAHNVEFDMACLARLGVATLPDIDCTYIAARCLLLQAVPDDAPQPQSFGLAALAERYLDETADKSIRDRDWLRDDAMDDEGRAYAVKDADLCLRLWAVLEAELRAVEIDDLTLFAGYEVLQRSLPATVGMTMTGMQFDAGAHVKLCRTLDRELADRKLELDRWCGGMIANHGSTAQVSDWIQTEVMGVPPTDPPKPKVESLIPFLKRIGGLKPDYGGELKSRDFPIKKRGLSLEDAALRAHDAGFDLGASLVASAGGWQAGDHERPSEDMLLAAIDLEMRVAPVYRPHDAKTISDWEEADQAWAERREKLNTNAEGFASRFLARTGSGWRTTTTGHLKITRGTSLRKAGVMAAIPEWSHIGNYLVTRERWNKSRKLLDAFGPRLADWRDDDGRIRGQYQTFAAITGRQSCVTPNLTQQPREEEFRALWVAPPGCDLVIADYSQLELRLLAVEAKDERLMDVYKSGRDVHAETASIAYHVPLGEVTKDQRRAAKAINFGLAYGSGASGLAENGGFSLEEAHALLASVLEAYPGLAQYRELAPVQAQEYGFIGIRPARRVLYDDDSKGTTAINYRIQGGAASVQMRALRRVLDRLEMERVVFDLPWLPAAGGFQLVASIHDEIILVSAQGKTSDMAANLLVKEMVAALVEIYPETEAMGMHRLTEAFQVQSWAGKE